MQPSERIPVIKRIARRLAAEEDWNEIDFVLDQFGFETLSYWDGSQYEYVRHLLKKESSQKLAALDHYLSGQAAAEDGPWEDGRFRLFISHIAKRKLSAHELKLALAFYGVDAFVAHEDINPGEQWQRVIEAALHSCDALAALLHSGFKESNWCDQEVGIALGRGVPVVPIKIEVTPYGFFGSVQAVAGLNRTAKDVAADLVEIYRNDKRTAEPITEAIVVRLIEAQSFHQANRLSRVLAEKPDRISGDQVRRLRRAQKDNSQVAGAFDVESSLSQIERAINVPGNPTGSRYVEDPF